MYARAHEDSLGPPVVRRQLPSVLDKPVGLGDEAMPIVSADMESTLVTNVPILGRGKLFGSYVNGPFRSITEQLHIVYAHVNRDSHNPPSSEAGVFPASLLGGL